MWTTQADLASPDDELEPVSLDPLSFDDEDVVLSLPLSDVEELSDVEAAAGFEEPSL